MQQKSWGGTAGSPRWLPNRVASRTADPQKGDRPRQGFPAKAEEVAESKMKSAPKRTGRQLRPLPPIAIAVILVTQLNCLQIAGIDPRRFLALVREHKDLPRTRIGKLVAVDVNYLRALLEKLAITGEQDELRKLADDHDEDAPTTAEGVLRVLGRRSQ